MTPLQDPERPADIEKRFDRFLGERLRPLTDSLAARRRRILWRSLFVAAAIFILGAGAGVFYFASQAKALGSVPSGYWVLPLLLPASLAVIAFSIIYVLSLQGMMGDFRRSLFDGMADFIDPAMRRRPAGSRPGPDWKDSLSLPDGCSVLPGEAFRGAAAGGELECGEALLSCPESSQMKGKKTGRGHFFRMEFPGKFRDACVIVGNACDEKPKDPTGAIPAIGLPAAELPGMERDFVLRASDPLLVGKLFAIGPMADLWAFNRKAGREFRLSARENRLDLFLLPGDSPHGAAPGFDSLNLALCRNFCIEARLFLAAARQVADDAEMW